MKPRNYLAFLLAEMAKLHGSFVFEAVAQG
jgi:hypothetical protein